MRHWLRHGWCSLTVRILDLDAIAPCECSWWKRLWYLATGR